MPASVTYKYRPETRLVQSGILRSQFGETSEALFLTQGYVYDSSAQAERRFKNEEPGYQYSRFSNPTVTMFERTSCESSWARASAMEFSYDCRRPKPRSPQTTAKTASAISHQP